MQNCCSYNSNIFFFKSKYKIYMQICLFPKRYKYVTYRALVFARRKVRVPNVCSRLYLRKYLSCYRVWNTPTTRASLKVADLHLRFWIAQRIDNIRFYSEFNILIPKMVHKFRLFVEIWNFDCWNLDIIVKTFLFSHSNGDNFICDQVFK